MKDKTILVVDDDPAICYAFKKTFEKKNFTTLTASNGEEAIEIITRKEPLVVFMDITMPEISGLTALQKIKEIKSQVPVIMITGNGNMETAIKAMQLGAFDYLTKPLDIDKVRITADRAIEMTIMRNQIDELQQKLAGTQSESKTRIIGKHSKIQEIFKKVGVISTTPNHTTVLILGETGTGKELVARAIHENGQYANEPFQVINCTVLPENLLESELFGHEKGAFTGADSRKIGKFELAGNGTLFLDEIGDMPESLQKKLLRVLQERTFERLGGNTQITLKSRIIAATNRNLSISVKRGDFREDLFYRLNVVEIVVPPLRERPEDIPLLAGYFIKEYSRKFNKNILAFSDEVSELLTKYNYPGNVRELENLIERAVALERGEVLTLQSFPKNLLQGDFKNDIDIPIRHKEFNTAKKIIIESFERKFLIERLKETSGNVTEAARISGIERQSFQRLMKKYELFSEDFKNK
jgi:two-component system response regulator AtoC